LAAQKGETKRFTYNEGMKRKCEAKNGTKGDARGKGSMRRKRKRLGKQWGEKEKAGRGGGAVS